ncbi:uncharacterized protein LOC144109800 [Amblyomma americanum]
MVVTLQKVSVPGDEALCITLRRLAYPNRLRDLEDLFGRHSSALSSLTNEVLRHVDECFFHLLDDFNNHKWLNLNTLEKFSQAIHAKRAPLTNCWAFIDGTARAICRPSRDQKVYFSGHKRFNALKYQSIMCPNGIICQLDGSYPGSKHDAGSGNADDAGASLVSLGTITTKAHRRRRDALERVAAAVAVPSSLVWSSSGPKALLSSVSGSSTTAASFVVSGSNPGALDTRGRYSP